MMDRRPHSAATCPKPMRWPNSCSAALRNVLMFKNGSFDEPTDLLRVSLRNPTLVSFPNHARCDADSRFLRSQPTSNIGVA
jgi:hypothetical protein